MGTTTASMNGNNEHVETEAEKAERIKRNRQEGMAKARAKLQAMKDNGEIATKPPKTNYRDLLWNDIFLALLRNREVRGSKDIPAVIKETDDALEILKKAGKA